MKRLACAALLCILPPLFPGVALSQASVSGHPDKRHKTGAISLRGVVSHLRSNGFVLQTRAHGPFSVSTQAATSIVEKGSTARLSVHEGDHVSVRGFLHGRKMQAIRIRIFPIKPKAFSMKGTVVSRTLNQIVIVGSGKTTQARLTGTTEILQGNKPATARQLKTGERVEVRLQYRNHILVVLRVHIYTVAVRKKHVRLHGIVSRSSRVSISVKSGGHTVVIALVKSTRVYVGSSRGYSASLKSGQTVTVYACCSGHPLSALSIHVRKTSAVHKATLVRGRVTAVSTTGITIITLNGAAVVQFTPSTIFELGSSRTRTGNVRIGDQVSVRGSYAGSRFQALRVHVFASSRRQRTLTGTLSSVTPAALTILSKGKQYRFSLTSKTSMTLNGRLSHPSSLRPRDRLRVRGEPGPKGLVALQVVATRSVKKPKAITVRGILGRLNGVRLTVIDSLGAKHEIRIPAGVHIRLHGRNAPTDAVFIGAGISARGLLVRGVLVAKTLTLSVRSRKVEGRVVRVAKSTVVLLLRNRQEATVQLLRGAKISDAGSTKSWLAIHKDAYLRATGYIQPSLALRTGKAQILHPVLDLSATVLSNSSDLLVETATKDQFKLVFLPTTQLSTGTAQVVMSRADILPGIRLHFIGRVGSDGSVALTTLSVRLARVTVRGLISGIERQDVHVQGTTGSIQIKIQSPTTITQGSRPLQLTDLVVHDDITVYGYSDGPGTVFARKVSVHRKRVSMTGTVESVTSGSFVLTAADGPHRVLLGASVSFSNGSSADVSIGKSVHVTGYLRGDNSIVAIRITFKKGKKLSSVVS